MSSLAFSAAYPASHSRALTGPAVRPVGSVPSASWQAQQEREATAGPSDARAAAAGLAVVAGGAAALSRRTRRRQRRDGVSQGCRGYVARAAGAPPLPGTAPTPPPVPQSVDPSELFGGFFSRSSVVSRTLAGLPPWLSMALLSAYTSVPVLSLLGATFCPSRTRLARGLAAALGCLFGTVAGSFLERAKKDAARTMVIRLLADNIREATATEDLKALVASARRRFGVAPGRVSADAFEEGALGAIYEGLLNAFLDGPEHDANDLPLLQRVKGALDLDGIVVGAAHKHAAQLLVSRGHSGLEGEPMRRAVDKLLFLSDRMFADEEPEEASIYELGRLRQVLRVSEREARARSTAVSRALYAQNLSAVVDKVDAQTGEALAGASAAFGLDGEEAAAMNAETYRRVAADLIAGGSLSAEGRATLERARGVLQLSDRAATAAFVAVAAPVLRKDVDAVAQSLQEEAAPPAESLEQAAALLLRRQEELGLSPTAAEEATVEGFVAMLRSLYETACKEARTSGTAVLRTLDKLLGFTRNANSLLVLLRGSQVSLSLTADQAAARRLYALFLERGLSNQAPSGAEQPEALARVLELSEADEEAVRVEVCQPKLRQLYADAIDRAEAEGGEPLLKAKPEISAQLAAFRLPFDAVNETQLEVYKNRLAKVMNRVIKALEKEALDAARGLLELSEADVRLLHLKAFGKVYQSSVEETMGRGGIIPEAQFQALEKLQVRLGLAADDAKQIFYSVVQERLKAMIKSAREAWEEATYTKEALVQINKERGKDIGDDPSADGTGGELGIKDSPQMEGVRGFKLMNELSKVAEFYLGNKVLVEGKEGEEAYPVTVGNFIDEKVKEEMFGIYAWNAKTCQDTEAQEGWERLRTHVGGLLGLSPKAQAKVLERMVSKWCGMFIKQKTQEQGELSPDNISTLLDWVPMYFGIDKAMTKEIVQVARKGMLQSRVLQLLNKPSVTSEDVQHFRDEVEGMDLEVCKDLELTKPQLRSLFRVEVAAALEDPNLTDEQKRDAVAGSTESFGLGDEEAVEELRELIKTRCRGCLANAVGDLLQGNDTQAVQEMQRLELLAAFAKGTDGVEIQQTQTWEVAPSMRKKLVEIYGKSAASGRGGQAPDIRLLEETLGLVAAPA